MTARPQEIDGLRVCARTMREEARKMLDLDAQSAIGRALDAYAGLYDLKVEALIRDADEPGQRLPVADELRQRLLAADDDPDTLAEIAREYMTATLAVADDTLRRPADATLADRIGTERNRAMFNAELTWATRSIEIIRAATS